MGICVIACRSDGIYSAIVVSLIFNARSGTSSEVHPDLELSVVPPSTSVALIGKELTEGAVFLSGPDYYQLCFSVRGCCL